MQTFTAFIAEAEESFGRGFWDNDKDKKCRTCGEKIYRGNRYYKVDGGVECGDCDYKVRSAKRKTVPLTSGQIDAMNRLQGMVKKDGTFPTVQPKGFTKPITLTNLNVTILNTLAAKKYISASMIFLGGKCRDLKILKRV